MQLPHDFIQLSDDIVVSVHAIRSVHVDDDQLVVGTDNMAYSVTFDDENAAKNAMNKTMEYLNIIEEL